MDRDRMTGLLNESGLMEQARTLVARLPQSSDDRRADRTQFVVAYMDLDGFKKLNDTYGHDVGDKSLCIFAESLSRELRSGEDLIARAHSAGDEFIALLVNSSTERARAALSRVEDDYLQGLDQQSINRAGNGVSYGCVHSREEMATLSELRAESAEDALKYLLRIAEERMRHAKQEKGAAR